MLRFDLEPPIQLTPTIVNALVKTAFLPLDLPLN
jgi:hypothetical protein